MNIGRIIINIDFPFEIENIFQNQFMIRSQQLESTAHFFKQNIR